MTDREELIRVLDYILNRARKPEIEVLQKAILRRIKDLNSGIFGYRISDLARRMSDSVKEQLISSQEVIKTVRRYISETLQQQMPEIPPEHLAILLDEWLPDSEQGDREEKQENEKEPPDSEILEPDVIHSMVVQFVNYSLGRMKKEDQQELAEGWSKQYWNCFSRATRRLLSDFLSGGISEERFWKKYEKIKSGRADR